MIAIKNIEAKDLEISFEGLTYTFPKGATVLVEEAVVNHLKEIVPMAFDFEVKLSKSDQVAKPRSVKTPSFVGPQAMSDQDMRVTKAGTATGTFSDAETEGPEFYGKGIEVEDLE